jgi:hypothetical protein
MSRTRIVKGKYTKAVGGNYNILAEGNVFSSAGGQVQENGFDNGVSYGSFERIGSNVNEDFEISFSLSKDKMYSTVVPFGILDFEGNYENANFAFNYSLLLSNVDSLEFKVLNEDGTTLFAITNLPEIVVTARRLPKLSQDIKDKKPEYNLSNPIKVWDWKSVFDPYNTSSSDYTKIGSYVIFWDGFDNDNVYDSSKFNNKKLKAVITASKNGKEKSKEVEFSTKYDEVDWVDVKIDKNNKKIDTTLRVNLKDGGAEGLECTTRDIDPDPKFRVPVTECPWDQVSKEATDFYKEEPIKTRTKSFEELRNLALAGINQYWSRNNSNIGKGVNINDELFETFVNALQDENGMKAPEIIYFTNSENGTFNRSHNWELHRELYYKVGYTYYSDSKNDNTKGWYYRKTSFADLVFQETSAHEIGHQLLFDFGGRNYTYSHKGTSGPTWIQQDPLPGTKYPPSPKEIDLMKYAEGNEPIDYYDRLVLSQEDSLGIVWLSKIKILSIYCVFSLLLSCNSKKNNEVQRETVEYYSGVVFDNQSKKNIQNVTVSCLLEDRVLKTTTDEKGYFKISDDKLDKRQLEMGAKLIFSKNGYITDTIETTQPAPEYKNYPNNYFFIYKKPDTLFMKKDDTKLLNNHE